MFRNNPQFLVLLIFFALSGLSWAVNKAREQKQIKQAREAQHRRREEELRTGRASGEEDGSVGPSAPLPSLQELAAKRQKQLEELRARQQAKARDGGRPGPVARPIPGSTVRQAPPTVPNAPRPVRSATPPIPVPRPAGSPGRGVPKPARGSQPPRPIGQGVPGPPRGRGAAKRKPIVIGSAPAKPRTPAPVRRIEDDRPVRRGIAASLDMITDDFGESSTKGLLTDIHAESMGVTAETTNLVEKGMLSRASLRQAIIMNEVLSPPVSLREGF